MRSAENGAATGTSQLSEEATNGILRGLHAARGFSHQLRINMDHIEGSVSPMQEDAERATKQATMLPGHF